MGTLVPDGFILNQVPFAGCLPATPYGPGLLVETLFNSFTLVISMGLEEARKVNTRLFSHPPCCPLLNVCESILLTNLGGLNGFSSENE